MVCVFSPASENDQILVQQTPYFAIQVMRVIAARLRRYMEAMA
jgi:hypothetical protein